MTLTFAATAFVAATMCSDTSNAKTSAAMSSRLQRNNNTNTHTNNNGDNNTTSMTSYSELHASA